MVLVEHALRLFDIALELGFLAPGKAEEHVEIIASDGRLGAHRSHSTKLLQLGGCADPGLLA